MGIRRVIGLGVLCFLVIAGIAWQYLGHVSEQRREEAVARVQLPAALVRSQEIAKALESGTGGTPHLTPSLGEDCGSDIERVAAFREIMERANEACETVGTEAGGAPAWDGRHGVETLTFAWEAFCAREAACLAQYEELLNEARTLIACGGPFFALDLSEASYTTAWEWNPDLYAVSLGDLFESDCRAAVYQNDPDRIVENALALLEIAASYTGWPWRLEGSGIAVLRAQDMIETHFGWGAVPPKAVPRLLDAIDQVRNSLDLPSAVEAEAVLELRERDDWRTTSLPDCVAHRGAYWGFRVWIWTKPPCAPWFNKDEAELVHLYERVQAAARLPYYKAEPILKQIEEEAAALPITRDSTRHAASLVPGMVLDHAMNLVRLDLFSIGLRLEKYYADHGVFPESLEDIDCTRLDPISGEAYRYEPSDSGFLLGTSFGLVQVEDAQGGVPSVDSVPGLVWRARYLEVGEGEGVPAPREAPILPYIDSGSRLTFQPPPTFTLPSQ